MFRRCAFLIATLVFAYTGQAIAGCERTAKTTTSTEVYSEAPVYVTGQGWQLGPPVVTLPEGTNISVCEEKKVGVLFDKRTWFWVEYELDTEAGNGWIFSGQTDLGVLLDGSGHKVAARPSLSFVSPANAQPTALAAGMPNNGLPQSVPFIIMTSSFIAIILGMVAKVVFDTIDQRRSFVLSDFGRNLIRSIVVAPIVFLAFLKLGNFAIVGDSNIMIGFCLAFQNGFFWQTVLQRPDQVTVVQNA